MSFSYYLPPLFLGMSINSEAIKNFQIEQYSKLHVIFHTTYSLCFQVCQLTVK